MRTYWLFGVLWLLAMPAGAEMYKCQRSGSSPVFRNDGCDPSERTISIDGVPLVEIQRQERERLERERLAKEQQERERKERERVERERQEGQRLAREQIAEAVRQSAVSATDASLPQSSSARYRKSALVMSCTEAIDLLTAIAKLKDQGYTMSRSLAVVDAQKSYSPGEKHEIKQIIINIYKYDLSPPQAAEAARLACR